MNWSEKRIDFENTVERYAPSQELVISCIVKNVAGRLRSETLRNLWYGRTTLENPVRNLSWQNFNCPNCKECFQEQRKSPWAITLPELVLGKLISLSDLGYPNLANKSNQQAKSRPVFWERASNMDPYLLHKVFGKSCWKVNGPRRFGCFCSGNFPKRTTGLKSMIIG